jgi:hypothetical protein
MKIRSHLTIMPDNNTYNLFSRQKFRENVSLFYFFLLYLSSERARESLTSEPVLKYFMQGQWITYTTRVETCYSN